MTPKWAHTLVTLQQKDEIRLGILKDSYGAAVKTAQPEEVLDISKISNLRVRKQGMGNAI